ncbi:MAG: N-6 DNA methylase [Deltaproteobacteria bacterium]|jgi:type I restriction-modification system DNA methylase subunit|nr:N-6 DNA methylase [Deltaproteobacteria bacterium]
MAFKTKELPKHIKHFPALPGMKPHEYSKIRLKENVQAAEKMAKLHDAFKAYGYEGHDLEVYLVRLLFCYFAEDSGIFQKDSFTNYITNTDIDGSSFSLRIGQLFEILNLQPENRSKRTLLTQELLQFPYIDGNLFAEQLKTAEFDAKMRQILLECSNFDWNTISPAIFGAMFQNVMDGNKRREIGAHYTSEENILKLINPLFMDDLWAEFERVKTDPNELELFHTKLSNLSFLDPACGCGNFLIITYRELRRLEHAVIKMKHDTGLLTLHISLLLKVNITQFFGIEYEEFPCQIAQVGMWLIDHQMNLEASELFGRYYTRLPLNQSATIINDNALRVNWETVVPKSQLSYIFGNPPFVGHQWRSQDQVDDMNLVFSNLSTYGKLDYVCCWHYKAAEFIQGTRIQVAFVSTNSIVQGESVSVLWKPLFDMDIEITFAYKSFLWNNEARGKAAVYCIIVGFSLSGIIEKKQIFTDNSVKTVNFINAYLNDAPNIFIKSRGKPIMKGLPRIMKGSQPTDGGNLILSQDERKELIKAFPSAKKLIRPLVSSDDYIYGSNRYCLWLKGVAPSEYRSIPPIMERLSKVAKIRQQSPTESVKHDAETPMLFTQIRQPDEDYLLIPRVTSENRQYIPIGYVSKNIISTDSNYIIPSASLFVFGILTSNVHMVWVRAICGRLKQSFRYTPTAYNCLPWCEPTNYQRSLIEKTAQGIIDARSLFPGNSLADLYDPLSMPPELNKAHSANDRAVMASYGFSFQNYPSEDVFIAKLIELYKKLSNLNDK